MLYLTDLLHILENYDMLYFNNNYYQYDEVMGTRENYIMRSLMICTDHQILFG